MPRQEGDLWRLRPGAVLTTGILGDATTPIADHGHRTANGVVA
jgi:hypothetical protein